MLSSDSQALHSNSRYFLLLCYFSYYVMNIIYCFIIQKTSSHLFQLMSLAKQVKLGPITSFLHLSQWSRLELRKQ